MQISDRIHSQKFLNFCAHKSNKLIFGDLLLFGTEKQISDFPFGQKVSKIREKHKKKINKLYPGQGDRLRHFSWDAPQMTHDQMLRSACQQSTYIDYEASI
jgi:hypothetical protein